MPGTRDGATWQAHAHGGGSILADVFGLPSEEAAIRWCRKALADKRLNAEGASYRIRLDDAPWTKVRP